MKSREEIRIEEKSTVDWERREGEE